MKTLLLLCFFSFLSYGSFNDLGTELDHLVIKAQKNKKFVGLSVLVIDKQRVLKKHYGYKDLQVEQAPNDQTIYELGSITKPFTRLLFASQEKVKLEDKLSLYLPKGVSSPLIKDEEIKIKHLLNHTGIIYSIPCVNGLDEWSKVKCFGVDLNGDENYYKNVKKKDLYDFLNYFSKLTIKYPDNYSVPGSYWAYSNVGTSFLSLSLEHAHGKTYEAMLSEKVLKPLGMKNTFFSVPEGFDLAKTYQKKSAKDQWNLFEVWSSNAMNGMGVLKSSLEDMEKFLQVNLEPQEAKIENAIKTSHGIMKNLSAEYNKSRCKKNKECDTGEKKFFYAWESFKLEEKSYLFHAGRTSSSEAMMLFNKEDHFGVVVLLNSKLGKIDHELQHLGNDLSLCIMNLLGKSEALKPFCKRFSENLGK